MLHSGNPSRLPLVYLVTTTSIGSLPYGKCRRSQRGLFLISSCAQRLTAVEPRTRREQPDSRVIRAPVDVGRHQSDHQPESRTSVHLSCRRLHTSRRSHVESSVVASADREHERRGVSMREICVNEARTFDLLKEGVAVRIIGRGVGDCSGWSVARAGAKTSWGEDDSVATPERARRSPGPATKERIRPRTQPPPQPASSSGPIRHALVHERSRALDRIGRRQMLLDAKVRSANRALQRKCHAVVSRRLRASNG